MLWKGLEEKLSAISPLYEQSKQYCFQIAIPNIGTFSV